MTAASKGLSWFYTTHYDDHEGSVLKIANSLWLQEDYPIKEEFAKKAAEQFYASAYSVDFSEQATVYGAVPQAVQRYGPVHRSGVDEYVADPRGDLFRKSAFAAR